MKKDRGFIALICNANSEIGFGHLSRLIAISEAMPSENKFCLHGEIEKSETINNMIRNTGISLVCCCEMKPYLVFVDTYDIEVFSSIIFNSKPYVVSLIDDSSPIIEANLYVEASPVKSDKKVPKELLLKFERSPLLRRQFFDFSEIPKPDGNDESGLNALIILGSTSNWERLLHLMVEAIRSFPKIQTLSVLTSDRRIVAYSDTLGLKTINPRRSLDLIVKDFDFVISAAGVTAWELIALKVNCLLMALVDNQLVQLDYLIQNELAFCVDLTDIEKSEVIDIKEVLKTYLENLGSSSERCKIGLTDGVERLVKLINQYGIIR
jgi:spore coat polysaccharide biosynthesis predicted glycosyltransferase SpsG